MKQRIYFNDVVARDGFQMEPTWIATEHKVALINALSLTGLAKIEATSFVSPKAIPNMRDAQAVLAQITRHPAVEYTVLVPNLRGAQRALEMPREYWPDELNLVMSVSHSHNQSNLRMIREQSFASLSSVIEWIDQRIPVNVSLSACFGCPIEGVIEANEVFTWLTRFAQLGVRGVTLCDTTGMAHPEQVRSVCSDALELANRLNMPQLTLHFHNTRGMGLANVLTAAQVGVNRFDGSLGGLGGCPYAPGASGNVCTEDSVYMLSLSGYDTGIDIAALLAAARGLPAIVGHATEGQLYKAGTNDQLHPAPIQ
jgi:hydroxymethylglutaryl-CoA lyase